MSENYLMLNGKRIDLTDEQVEAIFPKNEEVEAVKKSPLERVEFGKEYFYIDDCGEVSNSFEYNLDGDRGAFECANYCTDKAMMEQRALHETLNRLLWRYSEEHGGDSEWDGHTPHYSVYFESNLLQVCSTFYHNANGVVYFKDEETAVKAIIEVVSPFIEQHPEFVW